MGKKTKAKGRRSAAIASLIRRYCIHHGLVTDTNGVKYDQLAELVLDHLQIPKAKDVSYRQIMTQLYEQGVIRRFFPKKKNDGSVAVTTRKQEYYEELSTNEWALVRMKIIARDQHRCQMCDTTKNLQVHHKRYINGKKAWEYPDNLLITVCNRCHKNHHGVKDN